MEEREIKKILTLITAVVMLAVSCQKETPITEENTGNSSTIGNLTATIVKTKVTYTETPEFNLQPAWEIGDQIIGFDDAGNTYTLTVTSISDETATLSGTVPDGALHLIYKSGAQASDISSKTLAINYKDQVGDKTMPAVMLADGTVTDGACHFAFTNAGAIIGISAVNGVPSGSTISKITVTGKNLSTAQVSLDGSALELNAQIISIDTLGTAALSGITTTDVNGTLSSPIFLAVPVGAVIAKVSATVVKEPETMTIPSTTAEKKDIDYVEIEAKYDGTNLSTKKWAKWNVGANNEKDYGWYFAWAGTEGYFRYANTWQLHDATSFEFSYSLSSVKTAGASDYLYVKTQTFATTGHYFAWASTPYHTVSNSSTGWTKYIPTDQSSFWSGEGSPDNNLVLDLEDDAARVNWVGTWRMPTYAEFKAMREATYWAWDSTDEGYYVFSPDATHTSGTRVNSIPGDLSKASALLFFPVAGIGYGAFIKEEGSFGNYWSSDLYPAYPTDVYFFGFSSSAFRPQFSYYRYYGCSVRPVSD